MFVKELDGGGGETNAPAMLSYNETEITPVISRQANITRLIVKIMRKKG
jgi:hypothetical protein